jgi:hypothetical protein
VRVALVVAVLALLTACAVGDDASPGAAPSSSASSSSAPPGATACDEVVAGIDDFNLGDFEGTVGHFRAAVPLAEAEVDGSRDSELLLEAVRYYADLPPEDYLEASASSPEFARWKAVTLGQCAPGPGGPAPSDDESVLNA